MLVIFANRYAFSAASVHGSRVVLLLALAVGAVLGIAIPLWRLNHLRVIRSAEAHFPQFEERLRTFTQRQDAPGAFGELLAADTLRVATDRTAYLAGVHNASGRADESRHRLHSHARVACPVRSGVYGLRRGNAVVGTTQRAFVRSAGRAR